ncbi:MAG: biotin synthase BioB [Brevinematales bacterium]|nr:biotin synthase BioB [Brevinematales bacterium]
MREVSLLKKRILSGGEISFEEALELYKVESESLFAAAHEIRHVFCGKRADLCAILNAKSGGCEENCAYCAQSKHFFTGIQEYPLIDAKTALSRAKEYEKAGVHRFSLVTSGRSLGEKDFENILSLYHLLRKETTLSLCASLGTLSYEHLRALRQVGVSRYHHNLETGPAYFSSICSTHTFDDRVRTIEASLLAGLEVCSGGIFGLGERREDRLEMAFVLRSLRVTSVPLNILVPIKGTPLEHQPPLPEEEVYRTMAIYRFILPHASLRFAGGKERLGPGYGKAYTVGINASLVGNLLTTPGTAIHQEKHLIQKAGLEV